MNSPQRVALRVSRRFESLCASLLGLLLVTAPSQAAPSWAGFARNAQHDAVSSHSMQALNQIVWQTPVDLNPTGRPIHYGSPIVTEANNVIIPVKAGVADSFALEARKGTDGTLLWSFMTDYRLPPITSGTWLPPYGPTLDPNGRLYVPAAGGTLQYADGVDNPVAPTLTRIAFYGVANYDANPAAFNAGVRVCTPLTSDSQGNIFFGFRATGANPLGLTDGVARVGADGSGTYVATTVASAGLAAQTLLNCAPALSPDERTVYTVFRVASNNASGYIVSLDAATLAPLHQALLKDPADQSNARVTNSGSATPLVAPDGKVYYGVLEGAFGTNASRGWLLQFNADLSTGGVPGAFGWDTTPSVVMPSLVPSYAGASPYLLMTKYNNYAGAGAGGDGVNKIAILDPNDSQVDAAHTGATVMKEVITIAGVTVDSAQISAFPNAVLEWCINTAAVDPATKSVVANSEDGKVYRWDLTTNSLTEVVTLTGGVGEAYTPTLIAGDGRAYAINDKVLFAVGSAVPTAVNQRPDPGPDLELSRARPNPFTDEVSLRYSLSRADRVRLEIFDPRGRRVARLVDERVAAGEHTARWDGRDTQGLRCAAGFYVARVVAGPRAAARKIVYLP